MTYDLSDFFSHDQPLGDVQGLHGIEDQEVFRKYFHRANRPFETVLNEPTMIVGRRGAGKTDALSSHLFMPNRIGSYDPLVFFDAERAARSFQTILYKINEQVRQDAPSPLVEQVSALWSYLLWLTIFAEISRSNADHSSVKAISQFVNSHNLSDEESGPYDIVLRGLLALVEKFASLSEAERSLGFFQIFDRMSLSPCSFPEAKKAANSYLQETGKSGIVLFDSFEELDITQEATKLTLSGLLRGISQFNSGSDLVDIRCCIPAEAFYYVTEISSNVLKDFSRHTVLHWSSMEILQLCAKRFAAYLEIHHTDRLSEVLPDPTALETRPGTLEFWNHFFPEHVPNSHPGILEETIPYLLRHTQLLPRQMILLLNRCLKSHFDQGKSVYDQILPETIQNSVRETEGLIFQQIVKAHEFIWPNSSEQIIAVLKNVGNVTVSYGDLHRAFNRAGVRGFGNIYGFDDFLKMLSEMGAIGRFIRRTELFDVGQFEYSEPFRLVFNDTDKLCIHPCFTRVARVIAEGHTPRDYLPVYPLGANLDDPDRRDL